MFNLGQQPHQVRAAAPVMHPSGMAPRPARPPGTRNNMQDIYSQRALMSLALERQRMLANVLRGAGSVAPAPQIGINRPQGLPMVK